ncbi:nitrate reductase molybdenum cofactor assembly chaperone [Streptomyces sp. H39-S7]|uniref:nitrate reductase molybdenum cofactor assembly chaperone n=1 Tax=Streptomyces sp. H39-S7 TaxID=3004357 RepID=UPI0022B01CC1|nr:nitrate reductase molybdenum cofactor assembly chaperone [Streptomyces sp. H39-S7]MCZ4124960.1 nitrate reductase molybdenum cofactor assembly chaperone [Streptomyces sp. H39-S7]
MTPTRERNHVAWQVQSLLLAYPDARLLDQVSLLRGAADTLPDPVAAPLYRFLDHLTRTPLSELTADYVATFDQRKRCCLFLTYYAHGDTRRRGVALLRLKQAYAAAGQQLTDEELPDHLAVVLEFAAGGDSATGRALLTEHRAGLELLRLALRDADSPWADVLQSVSATLPALAGDERQAVAVLAAQGPPEEQVGLAPFAPPEFMPPPSTHRPTPQPQHPRGPR